MYTHLKPIDDIHKWCTLSLIKLNPARKKIFDYNKVDFPYIHRLYSSINFMYIITKGA